jgi:uncharacterized protein (DUF433 family)
MSSPGRPCLEFSIVAKVTQLPKDDPRLVQPLFLMQEAAAYLHVPRSTFQTWARGYERHNGRGRETVGAALVTAVDSPPGTPNIPFIGLAEGLALSAFRRAGVPMQRIRPALERLEDEMGLRHALASDRLYTDGAEILFDYGRQAGEETIAQLFVVRNQQRVFVAVVEQYLRHITYGADHWASRVRLPGYERTPVIVDPKRAFGRPVIQRVRVPVEELVDRWWAGDSIHVLADDFGLEKMEVEDVIRVATRIPAAA